MFKKKAREMDARSQPNWAIMGLNMTPNECRAPAWKKRRKKQPIKTYQP
jgi:hypothetical protein